jgi:ATP-dependent RNA helicase RhlE
VVGGTPMGPQRRAFERNVDVLVATPGRLLDHMQYPYGRFPGLEVVVLDEADRMLDMGFLPSIRRILAQLPDDRQMLLFSATLPPTILALARELLTDPIRIGIERTATPADAVTHAVYAIAQEQKTALLIALLRSEPIRNALVFTRTKHRADRLLRHLQRSGISAAVIHGNRSQAQRTRALSGFKSGEFRVLVATDIAARGIDIEDLSHVVNFDMPAVAEDYVHRIGRTGRGQATGDALTFTSPAERETLRAIERAIGRSLPRKSVPMCNAAERGRR